MTDYKKDFPLLAESDIAYLDNAATEQRPACVLDAEREFYERWNANPLRGLYELGVEATEQYEHARERVAQFVHAKSEREIIFTRNTTESINLISGLLKDSLIFLCLVLLLQTINNSLLLLL